MVEKLIAVPVIAIIVLYAGFIGVEAGVNYYNGHTEKLDFDLQQLHYLTVSLISGGTALKVAEKKWSKPQ